MPDKAGQTLRITEIFYSLQGEARTVAIVGVDEIDTARGYISWVSPMARALLKAREGETVVLRTPGGVEEIEVVEVRCTYDPATRGGDAPDGRKVKVTMHWVSAARAREATVRLYDRLFTVAEPDSEGDFKAHLNPHSLEIITDKCEPSLQAAQPEARYQFERLAYFALDKDSSPAPGGSPCARSARSAW